MKKDNKFIEPNAEIIRFYDNDIILTSDLGEINYPWWGGDEGGFPGNPTDR